MGALSDLWKSERGLLGIALIVACTVLCVVSRISVDQWLDYTRWIFASYAASKAVTGAAVAFAASREAEAHAVAARSAESRSALDNLVDFIKTRSSTPPTPPPPSPPPPGAP